MQHISPITLLIIVSNIYLSFKGFKNYSTKEARRSTWLPKRNFYKKNHQVG